MFRNCFVGLAITSVGLLSNRAYANFVDRVEAYNPGVGYATTFSGVPYTQSSAAVGEPNRNTSFGPVQPFNPPFDVSEIASIGKDGYMVLRFETPVQNAAGNLYELDFIIYGSTGFVDVDYPNGRTDGSASLFGNNTGLTRVSVSADNNIFYTLNPAVAPVVDTLYPTDGGGEFGVPVNPA